MKTTRHLGQSVSLVVLFALTSVGILGLMAFQSGALR